MADAATSGGPPRRSSWARKLAWLAGGALVLLAASYFVLTSSAFLKSFVLPRVGQALQAKLTADEISLSPFSQISLRKLQLQTTGAEPLVTAAEARVRYSLSAILGGNIAVSEVSLISPVVQVVQEADGTSNLDPLLKSRGQPATTPTSETAVQLAVKNVALKGGTVRFVQKAKDGSVQTSEISNLDLALDQLQNGQTSKLTLGTDLRFSLTHPATAKAPSERLEAKVTGTFDIGLDAKLGLQVAKGNARVDLAKTEGAFQELAGLAAVLQADLTPTEMRQMTLRFERAGQGLGQVSANGPLDLAKTEGRLNLVVQSIDRQVLNLFGAKQGWDFGRSTLDLTTVIDLAQKGGQIGATGRMTGRQIALQQKSQTTPPLDLDAEYEVTVNLERKTASVRKLTLVGRQEQKDLLSARLDRPMDLAWGNTAGTLPNSTFRLVLNQFNLASWHPLLGTNLPAGKVDLQLQLEALSGGKQLTARLSTQVQDLAARFGTNALGPADLRADLSGTLTDYRVADLKQFQVELRRKNEPLVKSSGLARCDLANQDLSLETDTEVVLPGLLAAFPMPGVAASAGLLKIHALVGQKEGKQTLLANLSLTNLTGGYDEYRVANFQTTAEANLALERGQLQILRAHLALRQGESAPSRVEMTGRYDLTNQAGQVTFKVVDLNTNVLRTVLGPALGDVKLISASLSASGSASYDPKGESSLKGEFKLANWLMEDPGKALPKTPLGADVQLDGALRQETLDLRQFSVALSPTPRAQNQIQLQGKVDLKKTNATPSQLSLRAASLDLTPYYDLFAGTGATNRTAALPKPASTAPPAEPAPVQLPLEQLSADLKVDRLFLREMAITNLQATATVSRAQIALKPLQLSLNGAPITAQGSVNLGVPGYAYDLTLQADKIPIEPLANSFTANLPGQYKGEIWAQARIKGAGTTGASLHKNLGGHVFFSLTNLNLEVVGPKTKRLLEPISLVLRVPELTATPLNWVNAKADFGQGKINVSEFGVLSQAFSASGQGTVQIAEVLTNSVIDLPVSIALRRGLAEKANLVSPNTPANTAYVALPSFAKLEGTLGNPKTEVNKLVISGLLLRSASGIPQVGGKASGILQGLGGALTGEKPVLGGTNSLVNTNFPSGAKTNKPAKLSPLDLLRLIPEKK